MKKFSFYIVEPGKPLGLVQTIEFSVEPTYAELHKLLQPIFKDWFEHVRIMFGKKEASMFVDESGLLKQLPINATAMQYYPGIIVGTAVIFTENVWF